VSTHGSFFFSLYTAILRSTNLIQLHSTIFFTQFFIFRVRLNLVQLSEQKDEEESMPQPATYEELLTQINQAFEQGDYAGVVEMTSYHVKNYQEHEPVLIYMQICAAARMGQNELVYQVLDHAIQQGCWYSEKALRESPSLRPLAGLPEYEKLIDRSIRAATKRKAFVEKLLVFDPDSGTPPYPLLFALHANGSSAREASAHWQSLAEKGWLLALPQSPDALWKGSYNWEDGEGSLQVLAHLFEQARSSYPVDTKQVILGGHSMGGKLAMELAISGKITSRGFLSIAPYISEEDLQFEKVDQARFKGVILFGEQDETISHNNIYRMAERLEAEGVEVMVQHFEGLGHEFGAPIQQALERAVDFILS
jgi:predicted esterase